MIATILSLKAVVKRVLPSDLKSEMDHHQMDTGKDLSVIVLPESLTGGGYTDYKESLELFQTL